MTESALVERWKAAAAVVCVLVYVALFYAADRLKLLTLLWILRPDDLIPEWWGGDVSRIGLADHLPVLLLAVSILAVAYLAGRLVLDALRIERQLTRLEVALVAAGVGLNLLSLLTLVFGLAALLHHRLLFLAIVVLVFALSAVRWKHWKRARHEQNAESGSEGSSQAATARVAIALSIPLVVLIVLGGMLPPWHFDVREYHLQVPKEWYQVGSIHFMPHNVYGNMPLGAQMHALLGMVLWRDWWWGALVGKTVIAAFAPLTALALYALGRRVHSHTCGAVAAFLFLSTPWVARVSMAGLIEGPYAFYLVLAVHLALLASKPSAAKPEDASPWPLHALAGFLAGSAVACKYPAVLFVVVPLLLWTALAPVGRVRAKPLLVFVLGVIAACGLWFGKNWVLSGNPTYPLMYEWFDGRTRTAEKHAQWTEAHSSPENGTTVPRLGKDLTALGLSGRYLSPLLVPLGVIALFSRQNRRLVLALAAFLLYAFAVWWLLTHRVDRFLVPVLPLAALLAAIGASWSATPFWRKWVLGLLFCGFVVNSLLIGSRLTGDNRFLVALDDLRVDLADQRDPGYFHTDPAHDFLNRAVPPGMKALLVGEAEVFDLEVPILYNTCFDSCVFEQLMKGRTRQQRLAALRSNRIAYVFVAWHELDRYRSPGNYGYSDYVTRERIYKEFVQEQGLLQPLSAEISGTGGELFEVVGWRQWRGEDHQSD